MRSGAPLPDRIQNAPSLMMGLELYYVSFMDLMATRQTGFGNGPIWWTTIQQYCDTHGITGLQAEAMHHHIKALDTTYLKLSSKKGEKSGNLGSVQ